MTKKGAVINMLAGGAVFLTSLVSYVSQPTKDMGESSMFNTMAVLGALGGFLAVAVNGWQYGKLQRAQVQEEVPEIAIPEPQIQIASAVRVNPNQVRIWVPAP